MNDANGYNHECRVTKSSVSFTNICYNKDSINNQSELIILRLFTMNVNQWVE